MAAFDVDYVLLQDVERELDISWRDCDTDAKIRALIKNSMMYLRDKLGDDIDFSEPGYPRELLVERVRYARDGALDVFENNYRSELLAAQNNRKVKSYAASLTISSDE